MTSIAPGDTKLRWFQHASDAFTRVLPEWLRLFLRNLLLGVTPHVPATLLDLPANGLPRRAFKAGFALGLAFCFGGSLLATWISGTLYVAAKGQLCFLKDWGNLINFAIVCPVYIGLGSALIVLVLQASNRLRAEALIQSESPRLPRAPFAIFVFLVIGVSAVLTTRYTWRRWTRAKAAADCRR